MHLGRWILTLLMTFCNSHLIGQKRSRDAFTPTETEGFPRKYRFCTAFTTYSTKPVREQSSKQCQYRRSNFPHCKMRFLYTNVCCEPVQNVGNKFLSFFFIFVISFNITKYRFIWFIWLRANSWNYLLGPRLWWQDSGWRWRYRDDKETRTRKDGCYEGRRTSNRGWNGGGMDSLSFSFFVVDLGLIKAFILFRFC